MKTLPALPLSLQDAIEAALSELDQAAMEARVHNDPLQLPFSALSAFLRAQRQLYAEAAARMEATHQQAPIVSGSDVQVAIGRTLQVHGTAMVKLLSKGIVLGSAGILLASIALSGGASYWLGHRHGVEEGASVGLSANAVIASMPVSEGVVWEQLIRDNPGTIAAQMATCRKDVSVQAGRQACNLPVWIEPASAAAVH